MALNSLRASMLSPLDSCQSPMPIFVVQNTIVMYTCACTPAGPPYVMYTCACTPVGPPYVHLQGRL
eukprot:10688816-Heterocapsa_arctica.AAC.1